MPARRPPPTRYSRRNHELGEQVRPRALAYEVDEGGQSRDFVAEGKQRYATFNSGDIRPYIQKGSYVKIREVTVNYQAPDALAKKIPGASSLRVNLSGRNLALFSKYWSFDPEFSNFGNSNFNRFIDLAPFPASRQFFFSVDVGF